MMQQPAPKIVTTIHQPQFSTQPQQPKKKGSNSMQISNLIGSSPAPMTQPNNMMSAQPQQARATIGGNQQAAMVGQGSFGQPTTVQLVNNQPTIAVATSPMATMQQQQSQNLMRSQQVQQQQPVQIPLVKQQPLGAALVTPGGQTLQLQPSLAAKQLTYSTVTQPAAQFGGSPTTVVTTNLATAAELGCQTADLFYRD